MYEGMQQAHAGVMLILPNRSYQTLGANHKKVLGRFKVNANQGFYFFLLSLSDRFNMPFGFVLGGNHSIYFPTHRIDHN